MLLALFTLPHVPVSYPKHSDMGMTLGYFYLYKFLEHQLKTRTSNRVGDGYMSLSNIFKTSLFLNKEHFDYVLLFFGTNLGMLLVVLIVWERSHGRVEK